MIFVRNSFKVVNIVKFVIRNQVKVSIRSVTSNSIQMAPVFNYPVARREDIKEEFHSTEVRVLIMQCKIHFLRQIKKNQ